MGVRSDQSEEESELEKGNWLSLYWELLFNYAMVLSYIEVAMESSRSGGFSVEGHDDLVGRTQKVLVLGQDP